MIVMPSRTLYSAVYHTNYNLTKYFCEIIISFSKLRLQCCIHYRWCNLWKC